MTWQFRPHQISHRRLPLHETALKPAPLLTSTDKNLNPDPETEFFPPTG